VQSGQSQKFTATVTNDPLSKGVTWALSGTGCSGAACGALSVASSASAAAITYTAPATAPAPAPASVTLTATSVADGTKSAAATITITAPPPAITVTVSPQTATVPAAGSQTFTATVTNDSQNKGVNWTLSGAGCSGTTCGSVSPASSASGAAVTYTAPATAPPGAVTLTATSVADGTKSAAATVTVTSAQAITVAVSPTTANVQAGGATQSFTATVTNDSQNKGVNWTLSGAACSEGNCGTISPTTSASGVAITYTSPPAVPTPATINLAAVSVADGTIRATAFITVTAPPAPSTPLLLGNAAVSEGFGLPVVATDAAGNIDVAWVSNGAEFVRSTDGGSTFSAPLIIPSNLPDSANSIQIALDANGNINLLWRADVSIGDAVASNFFSRSTDGGHTFSTPVNVSTTPVAAQLNVQPGGTVVIAWFDQTSSNLLAANSTDGVNFSTPVTVWTAVGNPMDLTTTVGSQGQVYIFWTQMITNGNCSILFSQSSDAMTFSPAASISANSGSCNQNPAAFIDPAGNIDVAWDGDGDSLFFNRSTDAGSTFSFPVSVPMSASPASQQIAVGPDDAIDILWESGSGVLFSRSLDGGNTFSAIPAALSLRGASSSPEFGVDSCNDVSVVEQGQASGIPIAFQHSTDGGVRFGSPAVLSNTLNDYEQRLALDKNGNVNVVWGVDGPADIFYVRVPTSCSNQ
jgi:hypothetical protein